MIVLVSKPDLYISFFFPILSERCIMANTINEKNGIIIAEKSDDLKFAFFKKSFSFNIFSPNHYAKISAFQ